MRREFLVVLVALAIVLLFTTVPALAQTVPQLPGEAKHGCRGLEQQNQAQPPPFEFPESLCGK